MPKKYCIRVPVADLRREPKPALFSSENDPLQESQLLLGECLTSSHQSDSWIHVEAVEQRRFHPQKAVWTGYPGWIHSSQLVEVESFPAYNLIVNTPWADLFQAGRHLCSISLGTRLEGLKQKGDTWQIRLPDGQEAMVATKSLRKLQPPLLDRAELLSLAEQLLHSPYVWGGRSAHRSDWKDQCTGMDCSGFLSLLYAVYGFTLPRDAQDQFLSAEPREYPQLKPADPIFLAPAEGPQRMRHVMLYAGEDLFLDTNRKDGKLVKSSGKERFGIALNELSWGQLVGKDRIFFGAFSGL